MSIDNFGHLEAKINKALEMITRLKDERSGLLESKQQLEDHIRHLTEENNHLKNDIEEKNRLLGEASNVNNETEEKMKYMIDSAIGKIDDILGSEI